MPMTGHDRNGSIDDAALEAALGWVVRLASDGAREADWLAFEDWLSRSAAHRRAYDAVEALWRDLDELGAAAPSRAGRADLPRRRRKTRIARAVVGGALAASLALGAVLWRARTPPALSYATAHGEQRSVTLADGTRIRLNSASSLTVSLGARERRAVLPEGQAVFDVAKDPQRPFVVAAGDRIVRVVGTEFDVLNHAGTLTVSVRRGLVEVRAADGAAASVRPLRLRPGQQLVHVRADQADRVQPDAQGAAFGWTEGRLVYRDARLDAVVQDLNRYVPTPIVVSPDAAAIRLSAVLMLDDEAAMLRRLAAFAPIKVVHEPWRFRLSLEGGRK